MLPISSLIVFLVRYGGGGPPPPPPGDGFWVDNLDNKIITNDGDHIIFTIMSFISNLDNILITNTGDQIVFNPG